VLKKVSELTLIAFTALIFVVANEIWKGEPSILTASIRLISIFPFAGLLAVWLLRKNIAEANVVVVCVSSMTLGMVLNSIAILANEGRMPIDPALEAAGFP